jgi:hypothetical protein
LDICFLIGLGSLIFGLIFICLLQAGKCWIYSFGNEVLFICVKKKKQWEYK